MNGTTEVMKRQNSTDQTKPMNTRNHQNKKDETKTKKEKKIRRQEQKKRKQTCHVPYL